MHTLKTEPRAQKMPEGSRWKQIHVSPAELVDYGRDFMPCHNEEQIQTIAETIREFGFTIPVVTGGDDSIICGQGRVEAAKRLEMRTIPTLPLQWMTEQERRLLSFALIRFGRLGNWAPEIAKIDMRQLGETRLNTEFKINGGFCDVRGNMWYPVPRPKS